eukprot:TRINITY_DN10462_c0_g1_i2.p1 TRINITY_DN10462_c0_g1~~TRINITY_DN10462_c0_g1_i2.p1  ORF type:complete len:1077 (+),score=356.13 TRINITY_DN10462_c0_g1_i2:177-3407(+)
MSSPLGADDQCTGDDFARQCTKFNKKIGEGGFGVVWQGQNLVTAQYVAIKEVRAEDESLTRETLREYQVLCELRHPHIVETYAYTYNKSRRTASIYMEYISQGSLSNVIKTVYPKGMPPALLSKYTGDVLKGLNFAHSKGLIHRDIKPANMLVAVSGSLKLADFGLCRKRRDETGSQVAGTIRYMSSDALKGRYNEGTDIWAVGCSLIEMASGTPPYHGSCLKGCQLTFAIAQGTLRPTIPMHVCSEYLDFVRLSFSESHPDGEGSASPRDGLTCEGLLTHAFLSLNERFTRKPSSPLGRKESRPHIHRHGEEDPNNSLQRRPHDGVLSAVSAPDSPNDSKMSHFRFGGPNRESFWTLRSKTNGNNNHNAGGKSTGTPTAGVNSLVQWLASPENDNVQYVDHPELALVELIKSGCADITEELVEQVTRRPVENYRESVDEVKGICFQRALLSGCLRYVAVLFCRDCETHERYFSLGCVRRAAKECLTIVERSLHVVRAGEAKKNFNGCIYILELLRSGLLLVLQAHGMHRTGWVCQRDLLSPPPEASHADPNASPDEEEEEEEAGEDSAATTPALDANDLAEALEKQIAASDILLRPGNVFDGERALVVRDYAFLREPPQRCSVFTKCFILMSRVPNPQEGLAQSISEELLNCVQDLAARRQERQPMPQRQGTYASVRSDETGRDSVLPSESDAPASSASDAAGNPEEWLPLYAGLENIFQTMVLFSGNPEVVANLYFQYPHGCGLSSLVADRDISPDVPWNVREKAFELILALYHAKLASPLPAEVLNHARTRVFPLMVCEGDTRTREVLHESCHYLMFRPAFDWTVVSYRCAGLAEHEQLIEDAEEMKRSDEYAQWFAYFCSTKEACGEALFRSHAAIPWLEFFRKVAMFPPHNKEQRFNEHYGYLFSLIRYLMQCEDVHGSGLLRERQTMVQRKRDFDPFQQYFPVATMVQDLVWLDQHAMFQLGADTRAAEVKLAAQPRGYFLLRPSKREQGALVMTANVSLPDGRVKVTHKIIKYVAEIGHLVIDAFPITRQQVDRPINGLRDLVEWLLDISPLNFRGGAGTPLSREPFEA